MKKAHKGIPLLQGTDNYHRWHSKIITHLKSLSLKGHAMGETVTPVKLHASKTDYNLAVQQLEYSKHMQQTLGTIKKLIGNNLLLSIKNATIAKEALNTLEAQLLVKNMARFSLKKKHNQSISSKHQEAAATLSRSSMTTLTTHESTSSRRKPASCKPLTTIFVPSCPVEPARTCNPIKVVNTSAGNSRNYSTTMGSPTYRLHHTFLSTIESLNGSTKLYSQWSMPTSLRIKHNLWGEALQTTVFMLN